MLDDEPDIENEIDVYNNLVKEEDYQNDERQTDTDAETGVKKFIEGFTVDDPSKAMALASDTESQIEQNVYHCSDCNINFPSIQDHIDSCHKGQEVIFQVRLILIYFIYDLSYILFHVTMCRLMQM